MVQGKFSINSQITEDLYRKLEKAANEINRSKSFIILKALEEYLDKNPIKN